VYADNAATSFPKPPGVVEAMARYASEVGATPGRALYAESLEGGRIMRVCRERLCRLIGGESASHVIFTLNTTDALNLAIHGLARHRRRREPGRPVHVVTTAFDHNSVLRPLHDLSRDGVRVTHVDAEARSGRVDPGAIRRAIEPDTLLVALNHAGNVTGVIQDAAGVARVCREAGVAFLLDAAQSAGHVPIDVRAWGVDLLAMPGHKGLLGPLGTGVLYLRPGMEKVVDSVRQGGTGSASEEDRQPESMPDKYEPGSHNAPGIAGLSAAVEYILSRGVGAIREHERGLVGRMLAGLREGGATVGGVSADPAGALADLTLLGPGEDVERTAVFTLVHARESPAELAMVLEQEFGVLARPGVHCAPRAHASLGTLSEPSRPGGLRLSFGALNTEQDVDHVLEALRYVCREYAGRSASGASRGRPGSATLTAGVTGPR
jgi:selenocysteine lyase/cysteine desulfurase